MIYTATEMDEWAPWRGLRTRQWKYARHEDRPWVLYDLEKDPYETNNLAAERSSRTLIAEFDRRIALHMAETGDEWTRRYDRPFR
jgi:arylsulfatase A-like enzyme